MIKSSVIATLINPHTVTQHLQETNSDKCTLPYRNLFFWTQSIAQNGFYLASKTVATRGCIQILQTGRLERELKMVQLSATRRSCIAILWVSLVSFAAITLWMQQQWIIPKVSVYFVIDSVRKILVTPLYIILDEVVKDLHTKRKCKTKIIIIIIITLLLLLLLLLQG
jgi:hypothetical protein